jgi:hypothetical protein
MTFDREEKYRVKADEQGWLCAECGGSLLGDGKVIQWAHRAPQRKDFLKRYGGKAIHSDDNGELVCSLECNKKAQARVNNGDADRIARACQ